MVDRILLEPRWCVPLFCRAVGKEMRLAGFPPHQNQEMSSKESSASSPSQEKKDTVKNFLYVLYKPKLKQEVEVGDLGI